MTIAEEDCFKNEPEGSITPTDISSDSPIREKTRELEKQLVSSTTGDVLVPVSASELNATEISSFRNKFQSPSATFTSPSNVMGQVFLDATFFEKFNRIRKILTMRNGIQRTWNLLVIFHQ